MVSIAFFGSRPKVSFSQMKIESFGQRNPRLFGAGSWIDTALNLAHQGFSPAASFVEADPVYTIDLYANRSDMPPVAPDIALDSVGLSGPMTDHHQSLHLLIAKDTGAKF